MTKKTVTLLLAATVLLASIAVAGCSTNTEPQKETSTASRLINYTSAKGFAMQYPTDWKATQPANGSVTIIFNLPTNNSTENLNVQVRNASGPRQTLGNYTQLTKSEIFRNPQNKLIEEKDVTLGGNAAHQVIYSNATKSGPLTVMQVWTFHGSVVYFVTYKATPSHYDQYVDTANGMLDSFYFT